MSGVAYIQRPGGTELHFDVVMSVTPEFVSTVTNNPVEKGADVADHIRKELDRVTLEVYVSDTPIIETDLEGNNTRGGAVRSKVLNIPEPTPTFIPTPGALFNALGSAVSGLISGAAPPTAAQVLSFSKEFDAGEECLKILEKIRDDAELVEIYTSAKVYSNMALVRIGGPKVDKDTGGGASFTLEFKQIRLVSVAFVAAPKPSVVQGHKMKDLGKQDAKPVTDPQKRSLLQSFRKGAL
jgi:hypothetical protein